jgi:hypothetical protein
MLYVIDEKSLVIYTFHGMEMFILTFGGAAYGWLSWI